MGVAREYTCLTCGRAAQQPVRKQGGGRWNVYCSARCRSRDSVRRRKYGVDAEAVRRILLRQQERCAGCRRPLLEEDGHVDHDHATGRVRGLLCNTCNFALGSVKDDPVILRGLMAYLDRDPSRPMIYIAGSLRNRRIPAVASALRDGTTWDVVDEWFSAGPTADDSWQAYEQGRGRTFAEALKSRAAQNTYMFDKSYLDLSDAVVLVMPAGRSGHLEIGYAAASGKATFLLLPEREEDIDDEDRFEVMPNFLGAVCPNVEDLKGHLQKLFTASPELRKALDD